MSGIVVSGTVGVPKAFHVGYLRKLQRRHDVVWVGDVRAAFEPIVSADQILYLFSRLQCVAGREPGGSANGREPRRASFPPDIESISHAAGRVHTDDPQPPLATVEMLLAHRPTPLVMLSGCFDLIHAGHVRLIELAGRYGTSPVVAALTTRAIRSQPKNQTRNRPLWSMQDRLTVLEELRERPRVLFFDGPDCLDLIAQLRPDFWIKERRDRGRDIVEQEAQLVEHYGGRVVWEDCGFPGLSTTAIELFLDSISHSRASPVVPNS